MPSGHRPPIPPGYARVALSGLAQAHAWTNVFYLQITGSSVVAGDITGLCNQIATAWNTNIAPQLPTQVTLTQVEIVYVPSVGNEITSAVTVSHAGSGGSGIIPDASSCFVVNWGISAYYRGGHPRWYVPGVQTANITNGSDISSSNATAIATAFSALMTAINAMTTTNISAVLLGTMSFASGNAWRGTPLFRHFTGVSCRLKLGSQRRRILA